MYVYIYICFYIYIYIYITTSNKKCHLFKYSTSPLDNCEIGLRFSPKPAWRDTLAIAAQARQKSKTGQLAVVNSSPLRLCCLVYSLEIGSVLGRRFCARS